MRRLVVTLAALALLGAGLLVHRMTQTPPAPLTPISFDMLPGWSTDAHGQAVAAFRRSCAEILSAGRGFEREARLSGRREDWTETCHAALALGATVSDAEARAFFEARFRPFRVEAAALFTGYYEPEAQGSAVATPEFATPLYGRPDDLVAFSAAERSATGLDYGRRTAAGPAPYPSRRDIEQGALRGRGLELVWLADPADAFFMQVQGSGRVRLADGTVRRLVYAGKSGRPYTAIGGVLAGWGELTRDELSMQTIRAWMKANPERAAELMWHNESFVFFEDAGIADPAEGPPGGQGVGLVPGRSLAVDRAWWAYGAPLWVATELAGEARPWQALMIAQDTGSAIKGAARGDIFFGFGEPAARLAGPLKSAGTLYALLPHAVAARVKP